MLLPLTHNMPANRLQLHLNKFVLFAIAGFVYVKICLFDFP